MGHHKNLICLVIFLLYVTMISTFPTTEDLKFKHNISSNATLIKTNIKHNSDKSSNITDSSVAESVYNPEKFHIPITMKPRGFNLPKNRATKSRPDTAAQNYYSTFLPNLPPSGLSRPYYSVNEEPLIDKFLSPHSKQFQPRQHSLSAYDASILGSGDFGVLKGGTFYPDEETAYSNEEASDFYYGEASNAHSGPSTEGFIQKYTYSEEQFAQFRDFADLGTPSDSAYSQYVVVYAAKNSTHAKKEDTKPKNIFEQLQEIDKEKALEQTKLKKTRNDLSTTKLKLVNTKLTEKKWIKKQQPKVSDEDPLIALS